MSHAVVWTASNLITDLGVLPGGTNSKANDVNNNKQVAAWSEKTGGVTRALLWTLH